MSQQIESDSENSSTKVEIEDLGPDLEEDFTTQNQGNSETHSSENANSNSKEEDDGSWILDLIDLSGLKNWPEQLQIEANEMLKRHAKVFSKMIWIWVEPTS